MAGKSWQEPQVLHPQPRTERINKLMGPPRLLAFSSLTVLRILILGNGIPALLGGAESSHTN